MPQARSYNTPLNLIWIIVDSVRNYRSGGDDRDKIEIMDKMASETVEFETVVTSAPSSLMSGSAMMTGSPSYLIARDFDNFSYDRSAFVSLGEILADKGYQTYGVLHYSYARERLGGKLIDLVGKEYYPPGLDPLRTWDNDELNEIFFRRFDAGLREPFFLCLWYNCRADYETSAKVELAIDMLKTSGLYDRSVFILCSDHGYPDPNRGMGPQWFKNQKLTHDVVLSDDNILVPLYIRHPELPPQKIETPVSTLDIMPTALELLGFPLNTEEMPLMEGRSLLPLINNKDATGLEGRKFRTDARYLMQTHRRTSIRGTKYKYVINHDDGIEEFYNLEEDPTEGHDLIANNDLAETVEEYRSEFRKTEDAAVSFHLQYLINQSKRLTDQAGDVNKALVVYSQAIPNIELVLQVIKNHFTGTELHLLAIGQVSPKAAELFDVIIQVNEDFDQQRLSAIHPDLHQNGYDIVAVPSNDLTSEQHRQVISIARWLGRQTPLVLDLNLNAIGTSKRSWRVWLRIAFERRIAYRRTPMLLFQDIGKFSARLLAQTRLWKKRASVRSPRNV